MGKCVEICPLCGSADVDVPRWVNVNTEVLGDDAGGYCYCNSCYQEFGCTDERPAIDCERKSKLVIEIELNGEEFEEDLPREVSEILDAVVRIGLDRIHDKGSFKMTDHVGRRLVEARLVEYLDPVLIDTEDGNA